MADYRYTGLVVDGPEKGSRVIFHENVRGCVVRMANGDLWQVTYKFVPNGPLPPPVPETTIRVNGHWESGVDIVRAG